MSDSFKTLFLSTVSSFADLSVTVQVASDGTISFLVYGKEGWTAYTNQTLQVDGSPSFLVSDVQIQYSSSVSASGISLYCSPGPYTLGASSTGVIEYQVGPHTFDGGVVKYTLTVAANGKVASREFTIKTTAGLGGDLDDIIVVAGPPDTGDTPPPPGRERPDDLVAAIGRYDLVFTTLIERLFRGRSDPLTEKLRFFMQLRNASNAVLAAQLPPRRYQINAPEEGCESPVQGDRGGGPRQAD